MQIKIFSGRANRPLAEKMADYLRRPLGKVEIKNFSDGEIWVHYEENIRGVDVFIVQSTNSPAQNREELNIMLHTAKFASAARITAVIPYFGYTRQDRKDKSRTPITAKLMADLIIVAGADRILTVDLHAAQEQGFFSIPSDHLYARPDFLRYLLNCGFGESTRPLVVMAPDVGAAKLARAYAKKLGDRQIAIIDKRRPEHGQSEVMNIIGDVAGCDVLLVDDLVDTAGTLCKAAEASKRAGANDIYALSTHGVLSGEAIDRIRRSQILKLFITDSIYRSPDSLDGKIEIVSIAPLLAEAIKRTHNNESISSLFE